jgi:hypothetical protein
MGCVICGAVVSAASEAMLDVISLQGRGNIGAGSSGFVSGFQRSEVDDYYISVVHQS